MSQAPSLAPPANPSGRGQRRAIKLVSCVIRPEKLFPVTEALNKLNLVGGMTVSDVQGFGRQKGYLELYRGESYRPRVLPKVRVELAVPEADLEAVLSAIQRTARTNEIGDGKIFVMDIVDAMRVRTRERGNSAL